MNDKTGIEYLDATWNPLTGCTRGCKECWARKLSQERLANMPAFSEEVREAYRTFKPTLHPSRLLEPSKVRKPSVVGVCFMGDLFDEETPTKSIKAVMAAICGPRAQHHTYIFLTKNPAKMADFFLKGLEYNTSDGYGVDLSRNKIYLGYSARNIGEYKAGLFDMAKLTANGWKTWVSFEPLHEYFGIYFDGVFPFSQVIAGAESGTNATPLRGDWVRCIRDHCKKTNTPFMYKQGPDHLTGKLVSLPLLDGRRHDDLIWRIGE